MQTNLASDVPGQAQFHDTALEDAWGISLNPAGTFWVSARAKNLSTVYTGDVNGNSFVVNDLEVTIPGGRPTGQVFNPPGSDFMISDGTTTARAAFIFATETGHISGWNPTVAGPPTPSTHAVLKASTEGAVYTGLAIHNNPAGSFLYAADFKNDKIDVFDRTYLPTSLAGSFVDPGIPDDYSAFNIWKVGSKLYIAYAQQLDGDAVPDGGGGYVSVFDTNGNFLNRLISEDHLNMPWGLAQAPGNFGEFSNAVLVGNHGDGMINAYDSTTGAFLGSLRGGSGDPVVIDGLYGLHFGNGTVSGDKNALYFAAGPEGGTHGLFGSLRLAPARVASVVVNDGAAQRSMVKSLTVTMDGPVTIDAGAFELHRQDGSLVDLNIATSIVNGRTVAVLTFAGPDVVAGSLADGNYALAIRGNLVHDAMGRALDGDGDGFAGGDRSDSFHRLYGDSDGDRDVDLLDLRRFLSTLGRRPGDAHYLAYFDVNGDDRIGVVDLVAFARRIGSRLAP
jgi:uncharacterized protein (TIGR03118 family)